MRSLVAAMCGVTALGNAARGFRRLFILNSIEKSGFFLCNDSDEFFYIGIFISLHRPNRTSVA